MLVTVDTSRSVLVVEDDEVIRELITMIFTDEGHTVVCAEGTDAALQLAREHQPDLILLDLSLPGLPGEAFIAAYRQLPNATASIVVISGHANLAAVAARAGADAYVAKPFDLTALLDTVQALFAVRSASSPHGAATDSGRD